MPPTILADLLRNSRRSGDSQALRVYKSLILWPIIIILSPSFQRAIHICGASGFIDTEANVIMPPYHWNCKHLIQSLSGLNNPVLREQLRMLWIGYDANKEQVETAKKQLSSWAHKHRIIKHWRRLPGIRLIRAATILAYLDTHRGPRRGPGCISTAVAGLRGLP